MASRLTEVIVDCHDLDRMVALRCSALGHTTTHSGDGWVAIRATGVDLTVTDLVAAAQPPALAFVLVPEEKVTKNRVHVDLTPTDRTQADEVARLIGLGASRCEVGQVSTPWIVLADPEGNEFCVMPSVESSLD